MSNDRPTPDDIATLTDAIEDCEVAWSVDDWSYQTGLHEESELERTVTWEPPTGELDPDVVSTGTSSEQRERIETIKDVVVRVEAEQDKGAPIWDVARIAVSEFGLSPHAAHHELDKLRTKGEVYEPQQGYLRTT